MRFRKRPIIVEAMPIEKVMKLSRSDEGFAQMPEWVADAYRAGQLINLHDTLSILTLEGRMRAPLSAWLIRGVNGELYGCDADVFAKTYEPAEI